MKNTVSPYILLSLICTFAVGGIAYHWTKSQYNADTFVAMCAFISCSLTVHLLLLLVKMKLNTKTTDDAVEVIPENESAFIVSAKEREEINRMRDVIQHIANDKLTDAARAEWLRVFDDFVSGKPLVEPFAGDIPLTNDEITRIYYMVWKALKVRGGLQTAKFIKRVFPDIFSTRSAETIYRKMAAVECDHIDEYFNAASKHYSP